MNTADLRAHLQGIYDQHGHLTRQMVVEAARPENSPLHAAVFDRGAEEAAEAYYLERAGQLIRKCRVIYVDSDDAEVSVPAFVSVASAAPPARVYKATEEVANDPLLTKMVLRDAEREWRALKARYGHLVEFMASVRDEAGRMVEAA